MSTQLPNAGLEQAFNEVVKFLATAGAGAIGGAALAHRLQGFGLPPNLATNMANLFSVHFGGIGRQDEANNWIALAGLIQFETLGQLPIDPVTGLPKTAQQCAEELGEWAYTLLPAQKRSMVLTMGIIFGDISGTLQSPTTGGTTPANEYQIRLSALDEAQRKAAETLFPLIGAAPDHAKMTRIAIANRLIPSRDYGHEGWEWWSEQWAEHQQSVQSARDMRDAARRRSQARIDEIRARVEDPVDGLNARIRTRWNAWQASGPTRAANRAMRRSQRRRRMWGRIIIFLIALIMCIVLHFLTRQ